MSMNPGLEQCLRFVNCQSQAPGRSALLNTAVGRRAVTISRQGGSGGHAVASVLADYLQRRSPAGCPWTIFDRNLVEKVIEDHNLPKRLARFMPEDRISEMADTMDELFGLHPPSWTLVRQTAETILHLAELGRVIIIGRGANVTTGKLPYVFHVRLVGSLEKRVEHMQVLEGLGRKETLALVRKEDRGRKRYLKKYFDKDIDDPLLYHLILNTDLVSYKEAAQLIGDAMLGVDAAKEGAQEPAALTDVAALR
jgi:cytidylate kinase